MKKMSVNPLHTMPAAVICEILQAESQQLIPISHEHLANLPQQQGILCWWLRKRAAPNLFNLYLEVKDYPVLCRTSAAGEEWLLVYVETCLRDSKVPNTIQHQVKHTLTQKHTMGHVKNGTLSALRSRIAALLGNDLLETDIENKVTLFLQTHMRVSYRLHDSLSAAAAKAVEVNWVQQLQPLLNFRYNENANLQAGYHVSRLCKIRCWEVVKNTRRRLR